MKGEDASKLSPEEDKSLLATPARSCPTRGQVTPQRASKFYEQQLAWQEACQEERGRRWEAQRTGTLLEEARAAQRQVPGSCGSPTSIEGLPSGGTSGILPRTVYDRQMLWRRQRDSDVEEQRRAQLEEIGRQPSSHRLRAGSPDGRGAAARGSSAPAGTMRRHPSAPSVTPQACSHGADPSSALVDRLRALREQNRSCSSLPGCGARHIRSTSSLGSHSAPTTPRRTGSASTTPRAATPNRARGAPARTSSAGPAVTPRSRVQSPPPGGATLGAPMQGAPPDVSSMALVERLRAARSQQQRCRPVAAAGAPMHAASSSACNTATRSRASGAASSSASRSRSAGRSCSTPATQRAPRCRSQTPRGALQRLSATNSNARQQVPQGACPRPQQAGLQGAHFAAGASAGLSQQAELLVAELQRGTPSNAAQRPGIGDEGDMADWIARDGDHGQPSAMPEPVQAPWMLERREEVDELLHVLTGGVA